jgi:hypothetical protein
MIEPTSRAALAALLLAASACAGSRYPGVEDTLVVVTDEAGEVLAGEVSLYSRSAEDRCETDDHPCSMRVPGGFYSIGFRKARPTRVTSGIGGSTGDERYRGCLRARVKLVPGTMITCKKQLEFNCARGAYDTMECGPATAARYGYKAKPHNDETTEAGDAPEQKQAPVSGEPAMKLQPEAPVAPRAPTAPVAPSAPVAPTAPAAPK